MTSNLGIKKLVDFGTGIGFNTTSNNVAAKDAVLMKELKSTYAPEVINRFDEIVIFNSLTQEDVKRISDIAIQDVIKRAAAIGYNLVVEDSMREHIVSVGFDEEFGGRYLNRAITSNIEDNFATFVFKNSPAENSTITISWEGEDKGATVTAKKRRL
jgi:ATP-dependent Clp protease ATP-binding subunit ClpC